MGRSLLNKLFTFLSFTKNIRTTGAIYQTSPAVERAMCTYVNKDEGRIYVEFGLGHGNITRQILASMGPNAKLYSFEINERFIRHVNNNIKDERLHIVNAGAQYIKEYVQDKVDGIVCSIPLSMMSLSDMDKIMTDSKEMLKHGSVLTIVQYSKKILNNLQQYYSKVEVEKKPNLPMAYIFHCHNT